MLNHAKNLGVSHADEFLWLLLISGVAFLLRTLLFVTCNMVVRFPTLLRWCSLSRVAATRRVKY